MYAIRSYYGIFDTLGIDNPSLIKACTGLAGGGGRMCDGVCGGYAGGSLAMASIFGRRRSNMDGDIEDKTAAYDMTIRLRQVFIKEYGSIICVITSYSIHYTKLYDA